MEAKLSQKQENPLLKSRILRASPSFSSPYLRFSLKSWETKNRSLKKQFRELAERWKFQVQELSTGQYCTNQFLVHVVKEGETLTLISRRYGVSIKEIAAANANIVDVDLVFEGQRLNIPSFNGSGETKIVRTVKNCVPLIDARKRCHRALKFLGGQENQRSFTVLSSNHLILAKSTGYFLVLVPLIAFCIRCIIGAFHHKVAEDLKHQAINESEAHHLGSRSMRWKSALRDIREPDDLDDESGQDSVSTSEDQSQAPFEEISHAYTELEPAYQKFLSECGMSKWGYWRGGSPE